MRRSVAAALLALSVVLAGCNGLVLGGDGTPEETLTPVDVPTDDPTPTPVSQLAPGLTGEGVTDAFALGDAHASVLDDTSYTMVENSTVVYSNGSIYSRWTTDARLAANDSRYYVVQNGSVGKSVDGTDTYRMALWSDGERALLAEERNNDTSYRSPRSPEGESVPPVEALGPDPTNREAIYAHFGAVETRVVNRTTRNDAMLYRVEATEMTSSVAFERVWRNPRNLSMTALVDSQGLVHEYRLHYTATLNGDTIEVTRRVRYTALGDTTVERPSWYDEAVENATTPDGTTRSR